MLIELFGCTSAGKSTLARRLCGEGGERNGDGARPVLGNDFVLARARLGWLRGRLLRSLVLDVLGLGACARAWRRERPFFSLLARCIAELPRTVSWSERLNIARNVFKRAGLHEIVRRNAPEGQLVLIDEGTLHSANALFVHVTAQPDCALLERFLQQVPLPDVAVQVRGEAAELVRRTLTRGHGRIPKGAPEAAERFVERSLRVSQRIASDPRVEPRLLFADPDAEVLVAARAPAKGGVERARRELESALR